MKVFNRIGEDIHSEMFQDVMYGIFQDAECSVFTLKMSDRSRYYLFSSKDELLRIADALENEKGGAIAVFSIETNNVETVINIQAIVSIETELFIRFENNESK